MYVNNGNMHSLVMVFDLIFQYNEIYNNTTDFSLEIKPLFQYEFKYLKKNDKNITGVSLITSNSTKTSKVNLNTFKSGYDEYLKYEFANNLTEAIIASPYFFPGNAYLESAKEIFYLKDFQLVTNLENTRTKNRLDTGYNVSNDKGSFFFQTAIGGFGKQLKDDKLQNLNDALAGAGLIMSLVGCAVDPTGLAFLSLATTVANLVTSSFLNPYVDGENMVVSETHNTTAAAQIAAYQKLIKASYMKLSTDSEGKNLGYTTKEHYVVAKYKMNNSTGSGMPIETLIRSIIGLKISGIYFSECDAELETSWTKRINKANSNEKQVSLGTQRLSVLCNYDNDYTFYNSENRYLNFSATNGLNFEIFDENNNLKDKNSLFEAGKTYTIKITNLTRNTYTDFNISQKTFNLSDNFNTDIILPSGYTTVRFKGAGIYNVNLIGNAKIALIDKSGNAVNYNRLNATNADFHSNGDVYITFYNPTADNVNISLKFVTVKDTVSLGDSTLNPQSILNTSKSVTLIFAGGDGSLFNRYKVSSQEDLNAVRFYNKKQFELVNDITLVGNWTPIQNFMGILNGKNYNINNLTIDIDNTTTIYYGLFGMLPNVGKVNAIQNVHLKNVNIIGNPKHDKEYIFVGGIAGFNYGQIQSCSVTGKIEVHRNNSAVGGIVGRNESALKNCNFGNNASARSVLKGNGDIGGLAGQTTFEIYKGLVTNTDLDIYIVERNRSIGGIVGINYNARLYMNVVDNIFMKCSNGYGTTGIYPKMGYIAGTMEDGSIYKVGGNNLSHDTKNIASPYKVDTFNGSWGVYGKYTGTMNIK